MNKTAIYSTIIASAIASLAILAVTSSEVDAVKPETEAVPKIPITDGLNFGVIVPNEGSITPGSSGFGGAQLLYGDTLCKINSLRQSGVLIVFGGDTTVLHQTNCFVSAAGELISLVGGADVNFKKGDVLVLAPRGGSNVEIFRDTT